MTAGRKGACDWLLQASGPIVRWRTASELCRGFHEPELTRLRRELVDHPLVQTWLGRLSAGRSGVNLDRIDPRTLQQLGGKVHGSTCTALENVLGKLAEFGMQAGMAVLDEQMLPLMRVFTARAEWQGDTTFQSAWESLVKSVFAWGLLRTGYRPDPPMRDYLYRHLESTHKIARDRVYDLYADRVELAGLPKAWAGKAILKQEVMAGYHLPLIHDMYMLAHWPADMLDSESAGLIDDIVAYILDPRFQALPVGYGYAWINERRACYSWGWSPHLPGFYGFDFHHPSEVGELVQRLELMAHFPAARRSRWFLSALQHLDQFRTGHGTSRFPSRYLHELPDGYYVSGALMGLGENRRGKAGLEIESTFRMIRILGLMGVGQDPSSQVAENPRPAINPRATGLRRTGDEGQRARQMRQFSMPRSESQVL